MPLLPNDINRSQTNSLNYYINREPPPPYQPVPQESRKILAPRRPAPLLARIAQANVRSRVEEYRNQLSLSDSDSEDQIQHHQLRQRARTQHHQLPRLKNEILLGKLFQ